MPNFCIFQDKLITPEDIYKFNIDKSKNNGWKKKYQLTSGLTKTIKWFLNNQNNLREK